MLRLILCALLLAGCATGPQMSELETTCVNTPFPQYGDCVQSALFAAYPNGHQHADLTRVYIAWLQAAGARVAAGEMGEPEARLGAAELYVRMQNIASERAYNAALSQQAATGQMLMGLALINASQPQPAPSNQIICNSTDMGLGHVRTICH